MAMKTAHEIVNEFIAEQKVDWKEFCEWFQDARYPQEEGNFYDSRFFEHLRAYVTERDGEAETTAAA